MSVCLHHSNGEVIYSGIISSYTTKILSHVSVFLLVPAHSGCTGWRAVKWVVVLCLWLLMQWRPLAVTHTSSV